MTAIIAPSEGIKYKREPHLQNIGANLYFLQNQQADKPYKVG